jgi:RNA polymerase sigma-70 factor (ECF subfamily)
VSATTATVAPDRAAFYQRLRAHDGDAFEELVREQAGKLLRLATRFVKNPEDAQDVVQEAFVSAYNAIERFDASADIGTWLHRITVNAALMRLRRPVEKREVALDDLLPVFGDDGHRYEPVSPWEGVDTLFERDETRALVRAAIDELPEASRNILLLCDIEELSGPEAAELLGISANAVRIRLHRARQALRELLDRRLRKRTP